MLYSIEVGNPNQIEQIIRTNKKIFKGMHLPEFIDKDLYQETFDKKKHLILNVVEGKMIIGNTIAIDRNKNYHIWILALTEDMIKQGIGKKLLDMHIRLAKEGKFKSVTITVYDIQHDIIKLIEDAKFVVYRKDIKEGFKDYRLKFD